VIGFEEEEKAVRQGKEDSQEEETKEEGRDFNDSAWREAHDQTTI
jgi:hypothetical protein